MDSSRSCELQPILDQEWCLELWHSPHWIGDLWTTTLSRYILTINFKFSIIDNNSQFTLLHFNKVWQTQKCWVKLNMDIVCQCHQIVLPLYMRLCSNVGTKTLCDDPPLKRSNGNSKTSSHSIRAITRKHTPTDP